MLKKIIVGALSIALLANPSMIVSSADDSNAETAVTESTVVEEASTEETDTTEALSPKEVGREIRLGLEYSVMDVVTFDKKVRLYDPNGNMYYPERGSSIWILGIDDVNQRFRVFSQSVAPEGGNVMYLLYSDVPNAKLISHEGYVIGDLCYDGRLDVFDLCLMKRGFIYGWDSSLEEILSDMNADGETSIADVVWLQQWLLGVIK